MSTSKKHLAQTGGPKAEHLLDIGTCTAQGQRYRGYWELGTGYWVLGTGYWLLATGYWLLATGYWLLATGYWLLRYSEM